MQNSESEPPADTLDALARVPFDDALDALAHTRRRELLFALLERDPPAWATTGTVDDRYRAGMIHVHLPKLADYGFVDWTPETSEVTRGTNFDAIEPLLELLVDSEDQLPDGWL